VSTDPTGGASAWSVEDIDGGNPMYGISCPSASECVATDIKGNVLSSTDPTGGPSAWTAQSVNDSAFMQVTCPSVSLCVAVGLFGSHVEVSTDPATSEWTSTSLPGVQAVACPSSSLCVTADGNSISYSADPASSDWTTYNVNETAVYLTSIACPTTTFCVAAGSSEGEVLVSTDPTGGASTWTPVLADPINCVATPSACDTEQIIASDQTGVHVVDTSREYEPQTPGLANLALDGDTLTWEHSGSPMSAQLTP
jgi:hypothetical protein